MATNQELFIIERVRALCFDMVKAIDGHTVEQLCRHSADFNGLDATLGDILFGLDCDDAEQDESNEEED